MTEPKNVYVGQRYVPKIMGEWDKTILYEGLSIVTNEGNSFTSKKRVPIGVDIFNEEYWVSTGNYNAQIENYRQDVRNVENNLTETNLDFDLFKTDFSENLLETKTDLDNLTDEYNTNKTTVNSSLENIIETTDSLNKNKNAIYIDAKNNPYINAYGDNIKRTIRDAYPHITLEDVQKIRLTATLDNSADWFALQFLMKKSLEVKKPLFIPAGEYIVDLSLYYGAYQHIYGAGADTKIDSAIANDWVIQLDPLNNSLGSQNILFEDFFVSGFRHIGTGGGIRINKSAHAGVVKNCWIKYFKETGQIGLKAHGTWYLYITECDISNNAIQIYLGGYDYVNDVTNNIVIRDCKISGTNGTGTSGVSLNNANATIISGCQIEGSLTGIFVNSRACVIENNYFENCHTRSIDVGPNGKGNKLLNNYVYHSRNSGNEIIYLGNNSSHTRVDGLFLRNLITGNIPVMINAGSSNNIVKSIALDDSEVTIAQSVVSYNNNNYIELIDNGEYKIQNTPVFSNGLSFENKSPAYLKKNTLYVIDGELRYYNGTSWFKLTTVPL